MKRAFNNLFRRGEANPIKILCLGVGLAIGLTMLAEVIFEQSYDNFLPRLEDTYRITEQYKSSQEDTWRPYTQTPGATAPGVKRYCPEVEAATRFTWLESGMHLVAEDQREVTANALLCDSSFFEVFPRRILIGENPHTGLEKENNAYISSRLAETLGIDIVGHTLTWKEYPDFKLNIVGIFEEFPENTHLPRIDVAVALPTIGQVRYDGRNNWLGNDSYKSYIRLYPGTKPDQLTDNVKRMLETNLPMEDLRKNGADYDIGFQPVGEIFSSSDYNRIMNIVFLAFAILMLAVAVLNYILLVISGMVNRAKSIATYRCYGAGSGDIYRMVLSESALHGLLSLALAVLIIFGIQDVVQEQIGHSLRSLFPPSTIAVCVAVTAFIVLLCGVMPGYLYTRIPVTYAYRRYTESKRHWKLGLLFVQFLLTTFFVAILAVISLQYRALTHYDPGFEYKDMLYVPLAGITQTEQQRCVQELKKLPEVAGVTWGYQLPSEHCSGNNVYNPETGQEYMNIADMYLVGDDYHKAFDIPVIEGSTFTPHLSDTVARQVMVSRKFVERMRELAGWTGSPIGKTVNITEHEGPLTVCGVYEEIHFGSQIAEDADERPSVMFYAPVPYSTNLFIRLRQLSPEGMKAVQKVVEETMPDRDKHAYSLALEMNALYDGILHVRNSILFTGACILLIALIGLIAYIRDEISRRHAEIAIRIIHGATVANVQRLFLLDLLKIALPATLIGALIAWRASISLLQLFAVKIELTWWLFTGCALVVLLIVWAVSSALVLKAARMNPTENLRTE